MTIGYLLNRQEPTIKLKWHQIPLNVGGQAATGGAGTRQGAPYLYIGGPKEFLTQKVLVGLDGQGRCQGLAI